MYRARKAHEYHTEESVTEAVSLLYFEATYGVSERKISLKATR